jgi:hypothetical protein
MTRGARGNVSYGGTRNPLHRPKGCIPETLYLWLRAPYFYPDYAFCSKNPFFIVEYSSEMCPTELFSTDALMGVKMSEWIRLVFFVATFLVPLVPAYIIYRVLPPSTVEVKGPFQGVEVKAAGSFAGYFVLLLASILVLKFVATPSPPQHEVWSVKGKISVGGSKNLKIESKTIIEPAPRNEEIDSAGNFIIPVVARPGHVKGERKFPKLTFAYPNHEIFTLILNEEFYEMEIDEDRRSIKIIESVDLSGLSDDKVDIKGVRPDKN